MSYHNMLNATYIINVISLGMLLMSACKKHSHLSQSDHLQLRRTSISGSKSGVIDQTRDHVQDAQRPKTYMFKSAVKGDLACYVELISLSTQEVEHYDSGFEWCERPELVGQKVIATFHLITVNDCDSLEPCGRSRETLGLKGLRIIE